MGIIGKALAALTLTVISISSALAAGGPPKCEFDIDDRSADKFVRCYSLDSLAKLERFIEDDRPVKVQVVNMPSDKFHLMATTTTDDANGGDNDG